MTGLSVATLIAGVVLVALGIAWLRGVLRFTGGGGAAPRVLILRMRQLPTIDATGISALRDVTRRSRKEGTAVILCGVDEHPRETMERAGLVELGPQNFVPTYREALELAERLVAETGRAA